MMAADTDDPVVGRRLRRHRSGFAFSSSSLSQSTATEGADPNELVEAHAVSLPVPTRPTVDTPPTPSTPSGNADEFNPRGRMEQVRQRASQYEREYRLGLLHRMMMRNIPLDQIAADLNISISQVYRDREELRRRLREEARSLDIEELIGDSKGFYEEAAALSLRAASMPSTPLPMKLAAIRTGLAAKNDMHRMFQTAGVYDVLRFRAAKDGTTGSDVRALMDRTERLLSGEDGLSLSDREADSGSEENIEL